MLLSYSSSNASLLGSCHMTAFVFCCNLYVLHIQESVQPSLHYKLCIASKFFCAHCKVDYRHVVRAVFIIYKIIFL